ncbi:MAG TPA: DNA mismatch repair protein MutS [Flavobacteriaceae bacterium]|nr:DNA mismatch repair protein MutS [Flavobacteriaceae bacterium]
MTNPKEFYTETIEIRESELKKIKTELLRSSILRLLVFTLGLIGIYGSLDDFKMMLILIFITLTLFIYLVFRHNKLLYKKKLLIALIDRNILELQVLERKFKNLPNGSEFQDPNHFYSHDIDLFGRGSFFQYINRTALAEGAECLSQLLLENDTANIQKKQEAIEDLSKRQLWQQDFSATASLLKTEVSTAFIAEWLTGYKRFIPNWWGIFAKVFAFVSTVLVFAYFLDLISGYFVGGWFFLGVTISGRFLKNVNSLSSDTSKILSTFNQFQQLLSKIESETFTSELLKEKRAAVSTAQNKASWIIKKFARNLDALDQRNNMLFGILGNGFFLWDIQQSLGIEKWIEAYGEQVPKWFETIIFFDAYNSLGNFTFNHPNYVFPEITSNKTILDAKNAGHPLLDPATMVSNDFKINSEEFFIITGANMAGKSTFLRTVSLLIIMGNMGLPVCATRLNYSPIKLITSMRTADSLTDDESYFFSELKRLKFIVERIKFDNYFIILDEILKGTNSTDKALGSRKFVEKLVDSNSTGIIATHDLSLCEIAEELPEVKNYYFDAQIIRDDLYFDYKFKEGICRNMNASFLLKKMKIVE